MASTQLYAYQMNLDVNINNKRYYSITTRTIELNEFLFVP